MEYGALFEPAAEGGFVVTIPVFRWGVSQGDTEQEALYAMLDNIKGVPYERMFPDDEDE